MRDADWIKDRPIAHRGYHDLNNRVWENSATAFERAVTSNYAIECDLQMARDGTPVVFHDAFLNRVCSRSGEVRKLATSELTSQRIGGTSDTIPTFDEMLKQVDGRTTLVVELKKQAEADVMDFARSVLQCLKGYSGVVALMSFEHDLLKALIDLDTPHPVGLTAFEVDIDHKRMNERALDMPIDFVSFRYSDLPSPLVKAVRGRNLPLITWTVTDLEGVRKSMKYADQITFEGFDPDSLQSPLESLD